MYVSARLSPQVVLDTIKGCVARHKKGEWISGGQWDAASFGKTPVHRSLLDQVAPDNPVALMDISVHAVWLNSKALQLAGITAKTPDPEGGVIERDAKESRPVCCGRVHERSCRR